MIYIKALRSINNALDTIINDEVDRVYGTGRQMLFVVPETTKASVERMLFDKILQLNPQCVSVGDTTVTSGMVDYDVTSFMKLAERVVTSRGIELENKSDDLFLRNIIYRIFVLHGEEFKTINRYVKRFEYIDMLIRLLGDFTRYGVDDNNLDEVLNSATEEDSFYDKVYDLKLLIKYIKETNDEFGYALMDNYLKRAVNIISEVNKNRNLLNRRVYSGVKKLINTDIVIYGFGSVRAFTPQENDFIELLSNLGANLYVYPLYDLNNPSYELYYFGNQVIDTFKMRGIIPSIEECNIPDNSKNNLRIISEAYSREENVIISENDIDNSVQLVKMNDCDDMLSYVCNEIIRLTRKENYRYSDIRVFCPDDAVTERFKGILHLFKMDAFIDREIVLSSTPMMRYVEILLELSLHKYPVEDVLRLFRTGMVPLTMELIDYYENFCKAKNITYGDRIFDESKYTDTGSEDNPRHHYIYLKDKGFVEGGLYLYKAVVKNRLEPIKDIIDRISVAETIAEKSAILMEHLDSLSYVVEGQRDEFLDRNDSDTASAIVRGYKEVMRLLASFANEANNIPISLEQFASLIKLDIRNKVMGTIPLTVDSIEIVDEASACYSPCKVLFMVGCNSGNFPHKGTSEGIMSNNELIRLNSEISIDLPDKALTQSKEEFIKSALILNVVSDKVYMFTLANDFESSVISFFKDALGYSSIPVKLFNTPVYGIPVEKRYDFTDAQISKENMRILSDNYSSLSVSTIERFNKCAFYYMMETVLRIRPRVDETSVKLNLLGLLVHDMFEHSIADIAKESLSVEGIGAYLETLDDSKLDSLADKYFNLARIRSTSPDRNTSLFEVMPGMKVKRVFKRLLPDILRYCVENKYMPTMFEQKIERLEVPYIVSVSDHQFVFRGSIDRVDVNEDDKSLRVVDYKTGSKTIDIKSLIAGVQLQLFAYALMLKNQKKDVVIDNVGYIEATLSNSKKKKSETSSIFEGSKFNRSDIDKAVDYVDFVIRKSCKSISNGEASALVNSMSVSTCDYCTFKGLCGNNPSRKTVRRVNTTLEDNEMDKARHKNGNSFTNEYYTDIMAKNKKGDEAKDGE